MLPSATPSDLHLRVDYPDLVLELETTALEKELKDDLQWPGRINRSGKTASITLPLGNGFRMRLSPVYKGNAGYFSWMSRSTDFCGEITTGAIHASIEVYSSKRDQNKTAIRFTLSEVTLEDLVIDAVCVAEEYLGFDLCPSFLEPYDSDSDSESTYDALLEYFSAEEITLLRDPNEDKAIKRDILSKFLESDDIEALLEDIQREEE